METAPEKGLFIMDINKYKGKNISIILITPVLISAIITGSVIQEIGAQSASSSLALSQAEDLPVIQGNSVLAISDPSLPLKSVQKIKMAVTGYSSTVWQTDSTPFITASGARVEDGIVANNLFAFGTKIRIPELYGDKIFVVKDRMNWKKGYYHLDIWFQTTQKAKDFGAKTVYIEVLEN